MISGGLVGRGGFGVGISLVGKGVGVSAGGGEVGVGVASCDEAVSPGDD